MNGSPPSDRAIAAAAAVLSLALVALIRWYALRRRILDVPNARSSHHQPVPRGGGLGLTAAVLATWIPATWPLVATIELGAAVAGIVLVLLIGWLDDRRSLGVVPRLLGQLSTGLLLLPLAVDGATTALQVGLAFVWVAIAIAAVNVVNFIDGIDGLIGLQGAVFATHLALSATGGTAAAQLGAALAGACLGFLVWNWAPARIFMGDAGSGSLAAMGLTGGILVFRAGEWSFVPIFLPLYAIFLDAAVTILRRWKRGEKLTSAHRTHLYQRLANEAGWGHARVALLYGAVALAGVMLVHLAESTAWLVLTSYVVAVTAVGWLLDRHVASRPGGSGARESKQPTPAQTV